MIAGAPDGDLGRDARPVPRAVAAGAVAAIDAILLAAIEDGMLGNGVAEIEDTDQAGQLLDLDDTAGAIGHAVIVAAEQPELQTLPEHRFDAVLKLERRVSHDGFVAVGGNYYSVPDRTRRVVEVQQLPGPVQSHHLADIVAEHPDHGRRRQERIDRSPRN